MFKELKIHFYLNFAMPCGTSRRAVEQLAQVRSLAENGNDKSQMQAKSLLLLNKGETYEEYNPKVPADERAEKKEAVEKTDPWLKMKAFDKTQIEVAPNPANARVNIKIQLREDELGSELRVVNYMGELIQKQLLLERYTSFDYTTANLASGVYLCTVLKEGKVILKTKLNITH